MQRSSPEGSLVHALDEHHLDHHSWGAERVKFGVKAVAMGKNRVTYNACAVTMSGFGAVGAVCVLS